MITSSDDRTLFASELNVGFKSSINEAQLRQPLIWLANKNSCGRTFFGTKKIDADILSQAVELNFFFPRQINFITTQVGILSAGLRLLNDYSL